MKVSGTILIVLIFILAVIVAVCYTNNKKKNEIISQKISQIDSLKSKINYISMDFGRSLFQTNCRKCHAGKYQTDNHLERIVDRIGERYLEFYLTRQDSLILAGDKYAIEVKKRFGNRGNSHNFTFSQTELKAIISYLK